jgi:hypothetical protein
MRRILPHRPRHWTFGGTAHHIQGDELMTLQKFGPYPVNIPERAIRRWDKVNMRMVDDVSPAETGKVIVEIDLAALINQLGPRALRSTGGKSIEASGMVVVRKVK